MAADRTDGKLILTGEQARYLAQQLNIELIKGELVVPKKLIGRWNDFKCGTYL